MSLPEKNDERKVLVDFFSELPLRELEILKKITDELHRAKEIHPSWPQDSIHQAAIVQEEAGELIRASLQHEFEGVSKQPMETEAIQTAAMALRFLLNG